MIVHKRDLIDCDWCKEPIERSDPGHWWIINGKHVALHDTDCREEWFLDQDRIDSFIKDIEIAPLT